MPIHPPPRLRRLDDAVFKQTAYEVMQEVFKLHNTIGCLFDEAIYKRALAARIEGARVEVPINLTFRDYRKTLYLDLLVADGAIFEFKAAERIHERHRAQLMNYLYLLELPHGKLINLRPETVDHEFVNATIPRSQRISFRVKDEAFMQRPGLAYCFCDLFTEILRDWGTCLDVLLYEEALLHIFGGSQTVARPVEIRIAGTPVGNQKLNLLCDNTSFHITSIRTGLDRYEEQLKRFLKHASVEAIQWANVGRKLVIYKTITKA